MLARYKGVCKRTHRCVISPGDMVESYNGGWAHVLCHHKKGTLAHSSMKRKQFPSTQCQRCGGDLADMNRGAESVCLSCGWTD